MGRIPGLDDCLVVHVTYSWVCHLSDVENARNHRRGRFNFYFNFLSVFMLVLVFWLVFSDSLFYLAGTVVLKANSKVY